MKLWHFACIFCFGIIIGEAYLLWWMDDQGKARRKWPTN